MSQEQVALEAEITTTYYGLVERDEKSPTVRMLERICRALDYPISELFSADVTCETDDDPFVYQTVNLLKSCSPEECEQLYWIIRDIVKYKSL
ncbi:MAG: helix-turn-helix domain-containing protein [Ruminococcus sp.]|nr:helix-turn-helix domain-containing protein [Ruminococcus sp.]